MVLFKIDGDIGDADIRRASDIYDVYIKGEADIYDVDIKGESDIYDVYINEDADIYDIYDTDMVLFRFDDVDSPSDTLLSNIDDATYNLR